MEKKRTTDLFRFATLRAPQQLSDERHTLGFIYHPDQSTSAILAGIDFNNDTLEEMKTKIANNASSFTPYTKKQNVGHSNMREFAHWLSVNKNNLERNELDAIVTTATTPIPISNQTYIDTWDNVYYDLLVEENPYVRQACLELIVAHNFINKYQNYSPGTTTDELEMKKKQSY